MVAAGLVHTVSSPLTGLVAFMSARPGAPIPIAAATTDAAAVRAAAFLAAHRILPIFTNATTGTIVGETSVAVRTQ